MDELNLSRNELVFIAMANEYCHDIESALETERAVFVSSMLKILPRIYIAISDVIDRTEDDDDMTYIDSYLAEDQYDYVRNSLYQLFGEYDTYLEVFEDDMKYSDTPIISTISENLTDIYQELYNFVSSVQDAPTELSKGYVMATKENFKSYWGQTLVNVIRALHSINYKDPISE